ncbi:MAG: DUF1080 domain-containing protein [Bacteroidales bacterium]|jgi:hypothetical protein|nr:DUF1080 domain-containing protein [Bacteroidales bacterium]
MKIKSIQIMVLLVLFLTGVSADSFTQGKEKKVKNSKKVKTEQIKLFNGKDLSNWAFHLKDPSADPAKVFMVQNGVIHITGSPFGYMRTIDTYSDYSLHVEWRWPSEATNSGVFIHVQLPDTIWPRCIECQLAAGNAGDFICANGSDMNERTDKSKKPVKKMAASSEKPVGEWNTMEVICKTNNIEVSINGVLQNKGTGLSISKGHICLQSEGKDIEFRNVVLTKLKK